MLMCMFIDTIYLSIMFFVDVHVLYNDMWMNIVDEYYLSIRILYMQEIKQNREKRYPASTYADGQAVGVGHILGQMAQPTPTAWPSA